MTPALPRRLFLASLVCAALAPGQLLANAAGPVTVFAAASLKTALDRIGLLYRDASGIEVQLTYGGSSALARHIQYGAPAQIFVSANAAWMDFLAAEDLIAVGSRVDLLTNRLVLIAAPGNRARLLIAPGFDLSGALGRGPLAMALVDAVPAGIYGREALQSLAIWDAVKDRVAQTDNVRAALRLVAASEAPFGIVYASDAIDETGVHVVGQFPEGSHEPIIYPAAILREFDSDAARAFLAFLSAPAARAVFEQQGFGTTGSGG